MLRIALTTIGLALVLVLGFPATAEAQRIKDVARVKGDRLQQMKGLGLVIGLAGTGDSTRFTLSQKLYSNLLGNLGMDISEEELKSKNVAAVMVDAQVPASTIPGSSIEVTISSVGDAKSLAGGRLLETTLFGPGSNSEVVYAVAQGSVRELPTSATVVGGTAILEEDISIPFQIEGDRFQVVLNRPDFSTASRIARAINEFPYLRFRLGGDHSIATAVNPGLVDVKIPAKLRSRHDTIELISRCMDIEIPDVDREALVVIDSATHMVTVNGAVRVAPVVVILGDAQIRILTPAGSSQQHPLLIDVIDALRVEGFTEEQIPKVIRNIDRSGALLGTLEEN
ncbi:MAG: flagellar basal body P-ring protein FlgI [Planctomycetota bacterium]